MEQYLSLIPLAFLYDDCLLVIRVLIRGCGAERVRELESRRYVKGCIVTLGIVCIIVSLLEFLRLPLYVINEVFPSSQHNQSVNVEEKIRIGEVVISLLFSVLYLICGVCFIVSSCLSQERRNCDRFFSWGAVLSIILVFILFVVKLHVEFLVGSIVGLLDVGEHFLETLILVPILYLFTLVQILICFVCCVVPCLAMGSVNVAHTSIVQVVENMSDNRVVENDQDSGGEVLGVVIMEESGEEIE